MTLKERIQADRVLALKEGNTVKRNLLGVLVGELELKGKTSTDEQVVSIIKKLIESNKLSNTTDENIYLECYLPTMLSTNELELIILSICDSYGFTKKKDMGKVMKVLKERVPGLYDGKVASYLVNKNLV